MTRNLRGGGNPELIFMPFHRFLHLCPLCCRPAVCLSLTSPFRFFSRRHSAFSLHGSLFALPCNVAILSFSCTAVSLRPCAAVFLPFPRDTAFLLIPNVFVPLSLRRHSVFSLHGSLFALPCNVAILSFSCTAVSLLPLRLRFSAVSLRHRF